MGTHNMKKIFTLLLSIATIATTSICFGQVASDFRRAAEQGAVSAQFNLGICYLIGQGVIQNDIQAVYWFRKAAEQGLSQAKTI